MKTNQKLILVCMVATMMQPILSKAQSLAYKNSTSDKPEEKKVDWQAAKLDDKGTNVRNGVEFYAKHTKCSTKKVTSPEKTTFDAPHHHSVTPDMYVSEPVN